MENQNNQQNSQQKNPQTADQTQTSWTNDSRLSGIDPAKLQMLLSLSGQVAGKNQNELMPFLLSAASRSRENGMTFSPQETDLIIEVMKQGKSKEEIAKIDKIRMMMRLLK